MRATSILDIVTYSSKNLLKLNSQHRIITSINPLLYYSGRGDSDLLRGGPAGSSYLFNCLYDFHALNNLAEDNVFAVQLLTVNVSSSRQYNCEIAYPWGGNSGDEKLGAISVTSGIGHGEQAGSGVLVFKVLVYRMRRFRKELAS